MASAPAARAERLAGSLRAACQSLEDSQHPWGKGLFWELLFKGAMQGCTVLWLLLFLSCSAVSTEGTSPLGL